MELYLRSFIEYSNDYNPCKGVNFINNNIKEVNNARTLPRTKLAVLAVLITSPA